MATKPAVHERRDEGYFGPDSVAWRIHASPSGMVGGLRTLLVQALNPLAIAAVSQHSTFREDPFKRLMNTGRYLVQTIYGDTYTADKAAARVRAIHSRISGIDDFTGLPYRVDDPELLMWVHCTEVHSFMYGYRLFERELTLEERNRYVAEMVTAAQLVGLPEACVPATYEDLRYYLRSQFMIASPNATEAMHFVLSPPVPLPGGKPPEVPAAKVLILGGKAAWSVPAAGAVAMLPRKAREEYGLPNLRPAIPSIKAGMAAFGAVARRFMPPPPDVVETLRSAGVYRDIS
jgi:uncharacterized protein (DUF2236 family)